MEFLIQVYGAKALVYLKYEGAIQALADELSRGLQIAQIEIEMRESFPYDLTGSLEVFGHELWLEKCDLCAGFGYTLKAETQHCLEESFSGQMHDLSLWLARYVSTICKIEALVLRDGQSSVLFEGGKASCYQAPNN